MTFGIFDFVVIGVALLFGIIGLVRGARKVLFGLVASLAAFVGAIVLAGVLGDLLTNSLPWYSSLAELLSNSLTTSFTYAGQTLEYKPDGDAYTLGFYDGEVWHALADAFEGSPLATFSGLLENPIQSLYTRETAARTPLSLPAILGNFFAGLIFKAVCFIVIFIVFIIIVKLLNKLLKKVVGGTHLGHFFDKLLGLVVGVAFGAIFIFVILSVLQILSPLEFMAPVNEAIDSSATGPYLKQYNFIYTLIEKYWGGSLGNLFGGSGTSGTTSGSGA